MNRNRSHKHIDRNDRIIYYITREKYLIKQTTNLTNLGPGY